MTMLTAMKASVNNRLFSRMLSRDADTGLRLMPNTLNGYGQFVKVNQATLQCPLEDFSPRFNHNF